LQDSIVRAASKSQCSKQGREQQSAFYLLDSNGRYQQELCASKLVTVLVLASSVGIAV
jgi:hypothetical protein